MFSIKNSVFATVAAILLTLKLLNQGSMPTDLGQTSESAAEQTGLLVVNTRGLDPAKDHGVDFERHVAPLLGRLGCNSAACHGAFGGKGGLQLSLFGYSARLDYENLRERIDTDDPEYSLMLQKPSGEEDHEGGIRFELGSSTYDTIKRWIDSGAHWSSGSGQVENLLIQPREILFKDLSATSRASAQQLRITAKFSDGSVEEVTEYCRFSSRDEGVADVSASGQVSPIRNGNTSIIVSYADAFAAVEVIVPFSSDRVVDSVSQPGERRGSPSIDSYLYAKLEKLNIPPSSIANDAEFLRRLTIDTIGTLPTPKEVDQFCQSTDPAKRERLIDELLAHPMHAALWATRMCDITKCDVEQMGENELMRHRRAQMWHGWFRKRFAVNTPYSEIARGIITATSRNGLSVNDWIEREETLLRESRTSFETDYADRDVLDLYWRRVDNTGGFPLKETAELTAAALTGVRLNCAQCHKHPFDRWTQDDYAAFANIFSQVVYGSSTELNVAVLNELDRRRAAKQDGQAIEPLPRLREVFISELLGRDIAGSEKGARVGPRAFESTEFSTGGDVRQQFYEWLVRTDNPYFARNFANRVWSVYFGVGIVDPVDDFSISNPPSHPELLDELSRSFIESNFDIRQLEKQILMSAAYQRSSTPIGVNRGDRRNFARQYVRPLLAEVALDCINKALGSNDDFGDEAPKNALAIEIGSNKLTSDAGRVLKILGRGERQTVCDCDRQTESDLRQFIFMINDATIHNKIKTGSIRELLKCDDSELLNQLYLRILGRRPHQAEINVGSEHLVNAADREAAFDDLVWALLNTREFNTNH